MTDTKRIRVDFSSVPEELEYYPWEVMLNQGFHWMDRYGNAHWIPDMETDYLQNALRFAMRACLSISNAWWSFTFSLNGEMAQDMAERTAMKYDEFDVPLIKGLENEISYRAEGTRPYDRWELEGSEWDLYMERKGMEHHDVIRSLMGMGQR